MSGDIAIREAFGQALKELGAKDPRVVVLDADVGSSSRSVLFGEAYPERYFNAGISELNMVNMSAGLALEGFVPYVNTFAVFMAGRAVDPVQSLIAYDSLNVRLCGTYSGLSDSYDGASHQSLTDIAVMRAMPNMTVICPSDPEQTKKAVFALADYEGPAYLRLSRAPAPVIYGDDAPFEIGKGILLRDGCDAAIVSTGTMLKAALDAADMLKARGISAAVADMHTVKPLDEEMIMQLAERTGAIVTVEEHGIYGGLGGAVAEVLAKNRPVPIETVGLTSFAESGDLNTIMKKYGLCAENIALRTAEAIKRKG